MSIYLLLIFVPRDKHVNVTDICGEMKLSKLLWDDVMKGIRAIVTQQVSHSAYRIKYIINEQYLNESH